MRNPTFKTGLKTAFMAVALCGLFFPAVVDAQQGTTAPTSRTTSRRSAAAGDRSKEHAAQSILNKGIEYLQNNQEQQGIKTISQIAQQYPETKAAIKADVVLADYYIEKKQFDLAIRRLQKLVNVEDEELQAEVIYKIGVSHYSSNQYNQAFMALRQVVNKFPGSVYANEAYYYIGLCHFSMSRWTQAVEALERVGTSIPMEAMNLEKLPLGEAGQRLFFKIYDEDLVVLYTEDEKSVLKVLVSDTNGDSEEVILEPIGREGSSFIGSIPSVPGLPKKGDNILQTKGGDIVTVEYLDTHTSSGQVNQKVFAKLELVSTATVGFTNGDYEDYAHGIFPDVEFFMRVRDLDMDVTPERDKVTVKVVSMYKVEKEAEPGAGIDFEEKEFEYKIRDTKEYVLTETDVRSGIFTGVSRAVLFDPETQSEPAAATKEPGGPLLVQQDDVIQIEYMDNDHIGGKSDPQLRTFKVDLLIGGIPDIGSQIRIVDDLEIKAKKNLVEGRIMLRLAQIFKDVGLSDYANRRATEGVDKIDEVLKIHAQSPLEKSLLEESFNTKWELLIVQDKIREAIAVCTLLIKTFPDSALVDKALIKIAQIKIIEGSEKSISEGLNIYRGIIQLPKSELKSEAQFRIAEVMEEQAMKKAAEMQEKDPTYKPNYGNVMIEYKKCADNYPDSAFAGQALEKIAKFYIAVEDFARVIDMMEQIFRDYPDADFLDKMLYNWSVAAFKLDRFEEAREKCDQLISEYPNSDEGKKATQLKTLINRRISELAGGSDDDE